MNYKKQYEILNKAIRSKCLDCSGRSRKNVENCQLTDCALYPYRIKNDKLNNPVYFMGVDPGKKGAIAIVDNELKCKELLKFDGDYPTMVDQIVNLIEKYYPEFVFLEKVHAYPEQGGVSIFTFGFVNGLIYGSLGGTAKIVYINVKDWQKYFNITSAIRAPKGANIKEKNKIRYKRKKELKLKSLTKAKELFPEVKDKIGKDDNISDALLICYYGIIHFKGLPSKGD